MHVREFLNHKPYADFVNDPGKLDTQGWNSESPVFEQLIRETKANRICEVGSWKGASAIHMARLLKEAEALEPEIVCVDTFLGNLEMWIDDNIKPVFTLKNGRSDVYEKFLNNVINSGFTDYITPFPTTSAIAAKFFRHHGITFDLIYIDASHDTYDVMSDINAYLDLAPVVFGDDYNWLSVRKGVDEMVSILSGHTFEVINEKWVLRRK